MNSMKYDLICTLSSFWVHGWQEILKVGIGIVVVMVLVDLVISYYRGRGL